MQSFRQAQDVKVKIAFLELAEAEPGFSAPPDPTDAV